MNAVGKKVVLWGRSKGIEKAYQKVAHLDILMGPDLDLKKAVKTDSMMVTQKVASMDNLMAAKMVGMLDEMTVDKMADWREIKLDASSDELLVVWSDNQKDIQSALMTVDSMEATTAALMDESLVAKKVSPTAASMEYKMVAARVVL